MKNAAMLFIALAFVPTGGSWGGAFLVRPAITYPPTVTDTTFLYRVEGDAIYSGVPDSNDVHALIQSTAIDSINGANDGAGVGFNARGPWDSGAIIACKNACSGRRYLPRRICGPSQIEYWGKVGVTIYHQFSPEIDVKVGPRGSLVPCVPVPAPGCGFDPWSRQKLMELAGRAVWEPAEDWAPIELTTKEEREGFRYLLEEWALFRIVEGSAGVPTVELLAASTRSYGEVRRADLAKAAAKPERQVGLGLDGWVLLLVDAPRHPLNGRHVPPPALRWEGGDAAWGAGDTAGAKRVLVRADFGEDRTLWNFEVLYAERPLTTDEERRLKTGLGLEYFTDRSHRATAYATLSLGPQGVAVERGFSVPSQCCCLLPNGCDPDFPEVAGVAAHH